MSCILCETLIIKIAICYSSQINMSAKSKLFRVIVLLALVAQVGFVPMRMAQASDFAEIKAKAEKGDIEAQFTLSNVYDQGNGVPKDSSESLKWLRKAAEQNHPKAQLFLGLRYHYGKNVSKDDIESTKWIRKAAEQGNAEAQFLLGSCYSKGKGVAKDAQETIKWYQKSAEQGVPEAQAALGACYAEGFGVAENHVEASQWFRKAAEQGHTMAQYFLGCCYASGEGVIKDYVEAAKCYRKAAEQGLAQAQRNLGDLYVKGDGVTKDFVEAYKWWHLATEQGDEWSKTHLSSLNPLMTHEQIAEGQRLAAAFVGRRDEPRKKDARVEKGISISQAVVPQESGGGTANTSSNRINQDILNAVSRSSVTIEAPNGSGSGFIYKADDAFWTVSNTHVIGMAFHFSDLKICDQDGDTIPLEKELKVDLEADICMLKLAKNASPKGFLVSGKMPFVGDKIWVAGNAKGDGIISLIDGTIKGLGSRAGVPIFEVSAQFVPGFSGGPIVNEKGEALGIATYAISLTESQKKEDFFKESPFKTPRRMGVRMSRISQAKPLEFSHLYLHHKASEDRKNIFELYLNLYRDKKPQQTLTEIRGYWARADKPIMAQRSFAGVRESGMLDDYYDALEFLAKVSRAVENERLKSQAVSHPENFDQPSWRDGAEEERAFKELVGQGYDPVDLARYSRAGGSLVMLRNEEMKAAEATRTRIRTELDFLHKLQTKKDSTFLHQDVHKYIDEIIEWKLKLLTGK
ncbi:MAG: SEL1-like repeat protein [Candidatus Tectomicrobia bacterium]|nr:SEL1-like repeat protein [Candidatus Tectomicrobia bacterium]